MIPNPIVVPMTVSESTQQFALGVSEALTQVSLDLATTISITAGNTYTGAYEVTPTQSTQILETNGLKMTDNVTINPIPSNYGLITWNGSTLTVS